MADKSLVYVLSALVGIVCLLFGVMWSPLADVKVVQNQSVVYQDKIVYQNVSVPNPVASQDSPLDKAKAEWQKRLGEHDEWMTCDDVLYDSDQVSLSVLSWHPEYGRDSSKYSVVFDGRLSYKDGSNNHACKQDMSFIVSFEEGEKPIVEEA